KRTMRPTAKARSPLAIPASFGRNGAPAAVPSNRRATRSGSSSQSSRATRMAPSGIRTKFASSASETTRPLRSGATTCPTVRLTPTASMLDTTNASIAADTALLSSVILGLLLQSGGRRVNVTRTVCVEMTMRYSHLAPAHNAAAVEKLAAALERSTRLLGPQHRLPTRLPAVAREQTAADWNATGTV